MCSCIQNLAVNEEFLKLLCLVRFSRDLTFVHGHMILDKMAVSHDEMKALVDEEPMMVLMEFMRLQNLRLIDLFSSLDTDRSKSLTKEEFKLGLQVGPLHFLADGMTARFLLITCVCCEL